MKANTALLNGLNYIMANSQSTTINIINYILNESDYDDAVTQTLAGSAVVSGLIFPLNSLSASQYPLLQQEGKVLEKDKVMYIGSVNLSGNVLVNIGNDNYTIMPNGIRTFEVNGSHIYSEIFLRFTIPGSLFS